MILCFSLIFLKFDINIKSQEKEVPKGVGVHLHDIKLNSEDIDLLKKANVSWVRIDLRWAKIEQEKGVYDFLKTGYDDFIHTLRDLGIKPYITLDYSNPIYEKNQAITTSYGREAFSRYVEAALNRYSNQGAIWEIWNEPNKTGFWEIQPSFEDYSLLVKEVAPLIKAHNEYVVAPALAGLYDEVLPWLEETFKRGLLEEVDAISVHPYRSNNPETVFNDYKKLNSLINKYTDKYIPIFSGEWGYSTTYLSEEKQAQYLIRMILTNELSNIPISILFDWKNYGEDKDNIEHNYGLLLQDNKSKISYDAVKNYQTLLRDSNFVKKLEYGGSGDYILLFTDSEENNILVYWTTDKVHDITIHSNKGSGSIVSLKGERKNVEWKADQLRLELSNAPQYLIIDR